MYDVSGARVVPGDITGRPWQGVVARAVELAGTSQILEYDVPTGTYDVTRRAIYREAGRQQTAIVVRKGPVAGGQVTLRLQVPGEPHTGGRVVDEDAGASPAG